MVILRRNMLMLRCAISLITALTFALSTPAQAQAPSTHVDEELASANRSFVEGRVKEGVERLTKLLREIDPQKDKDAYWRTSTSLIQMLSETENHSLAGQVLSALIATKIPESQSVYFQWTQFYLGRNLAYSGKADEGEKYLRALMAGDARLVHIPAQRAAAMLMSTIELDRRNIAQSAIWMRRAVIGTLVDKAAASEEIVDVLTHYANFLSRTRRLIEADNIFHKLARIYDQTFPHRGSKYLYFTSKYVSNLSGLGNFPGVDNVLKILNENVASVDVVANSVREGLFHDNLYQLARVSGLKPASSADEKPIVGRLKQITADFPSFSKTPSAGIAFSYYALVAGELDLAEQFISAIDPNAPLDDQDAAYELLLKSFIAARRSRFDESIALARDGLGRIALFHRLAENESSSRLPTLSIEERVVLSLILGLNSPHISTFDQASSLFQLQQYLTRDKGKLGLNSRAGRQRVRSDLQREDLRSRDRLMELRDRIMEKASEDLLARVLPIRNYSPGQTNDYGPLIRLEQIEDWISTADDKLQRSVPDFAMDSADRPIELDAIQKVIKPNEALVLHNIAGGSGFVTTCVNSKSWTFHVQGLGAEGFRKLGFDHKLLLSAVHATNEPSEVLDGEFPSESSYRLYQTFFNGIEECLRNKTHILIAPDPDFFSFPWNALLTEPPSKNHKFRHRDAAWIVKLYSLSLLPSVRSLYQLRTDLPPSRAKEHFLGIGDPNLKGAPERNKEIALAPLFTSRGVANRKAISALPALPETAEELQIAAKALGASESHILLGPKATERELRKQPLNDFRVISFATHAVVAGEIEGITEPSLVLSPGEDEDNQKNDGLLTASEIANLTFDANLVILSACNTAGSDGHASGRGLSGLADALFFAGARSIAVTQWSVDSETATLIGSGLISRSVGLGGGGVAEGLRKTMVDYIAAAKEDYLAHPRFWAAFIIAGDGAVRPLDGAAANDDDGNSIKLDWQHLPSSPADAEFTGIAAVYKSAFAIGMQKPPAGEKRAGSYVAKITGKNVAVIARDAEMARTGVVSLGDRVGILGYYPAGDKSSAVFRLMDTGGQEIWRFVVQDSPSWNFPISIIQTAEAYILLSIENSYLPSAGPSTLVLNLVSKSGVEIAHQRITLPLNQVWSSPSRVTSDANGNLTVAIVGDALQRSPQQPTMWTNPLTGSKIYCTQPNATVLLAIETKALKLQLQKQLNDAQIVSIRQNDGHLYAAVNFRTHCHLETNARLVEIDPKFGLRSLFETSYINSVEVKDFEVTPDYFVVVGSSQTFLPTALTTKILSLKELKTYQAPDVWSESFWEKNEQVGNGLILVLRKDGAVVADRIFPDLENRSISNVAAMGRDHFIAVGSAFGDRGWVVAFSLPKPGYDLRKNFASWLEWSRSLFYGAR